MNSIILDDAAAAVNSLILHESVNLKDGYFFLRSSPSSCLDDQIENEGRALRQMRVPRVMKSRYTNVRVAGKPKLVLGNITRLLKSLRRDLPSFDFNGLPLELEPVS